MLICHTKSEKISTTNTNFKNTYFQYPTLTPVRGELTYEALTRTYREIKVNGNLVTISLEEGKSGYLGLVVSSETHERIAPNRRSIKPVNPDVLGILDNATQYQFA